ncbi:hypothetical protein BTVI_91487 [Pitangus sulphuratus]|nr:hypothetical protein BTVI_91487 [Pitangus sulphuratus]
MGLGNQQHRKVYDEAMYLLELDLDQGIGEGTLCPIIQVSNKDVGQFGTIDSGALVIGLQLDFMYNCDNEMEYTLRKLLEDTKLVRGDETPDGDLYRAEK